MSRVRNVSTKAKSQWEETLDYFLLFKQAQGLAERTLSDYREHVKMFFKTTSASIEDYNALKLAVMRYFAESASLSPYTFNTRRKLLKVYFSWLASEGFIPESPVNVKKRKEDDVPRAVNEEVISKLLSLPNQTTFGGLRDYALLILTMDAGIRPREAAGLKIKDLNLTALEVKIPAEIAKTRVSRSLPISTVTVEALRKLIQARHPEWGENVPVFCTENGTVLTRFAWARRMRSYSEKLGTSVQPYDLRHTFAVMYLRHGGNAFSLQRTLGHNTLSMTKRYVALSESDLYQQHAIASPINTLVPKKHRVRKV
jgi:site-specific recombinase XerD